MVSNGGNLCLFQHFDIHSFDLATAKHAKSFKSNAKFGSIDLRILFQIPLSTEGKEWYYYVDKNVTIDLLERLTDEFLAIWDRSPAKLKNKLSSTIKDLTTSARSVRMVSKPSTIHSQRISGIGIPIFNSILVCALFFHFVERCS